MQRLNAANRSLQRIPTSTTVDMKYDLFLGFSCNILHLLAWVLPRMLSEQLAAVCGVPGVVVVDPDPE